MNIIGAQFLLDFAEVAMRCWFIGAHRTAAFRVVATLANRVAALTGTGFYLDPAW
jgi:hypothetical protein